MDLCFQRKVKNNEQKAACKGKAYQLVVSSYDASCAQTHVNVSDLEMHLKCKNKTVMLVYLYCSVCKRFGIAQTLSHVLLPHA